LVTKVYFPRLILPGSSMVVNLIDFAVSCVVLVVLFIAYRFVPGPAFVAVPLFLLLAVVTAAGLGLWFAALIVRYRDIRHLVPFLMQLGLFASPVGFSSDVVPEQWRMLYALNPMVGVIDGFRWSILGGAHELHPPALVVSVVVAVALLASGLAHFRRVERTFADVI
jgi:lipopolysaccharide transport system permease protein